MGWGCVALLKSRDGASSLIITTQALVRLVSLLRPPKCRVTGGQTMIWPTRETATRHNLGIVSYPPVTGKEKWFLGPDTQKLPNSNLLVHAHNSALCSRWPPEIFQAVQSSAFTKYIAAFCPHGTSGHCSESLVSLGFGHKWPWN